MCACAVVAAEPLGPISIRVGRFNLSATSNVTEVLKLKHQYKDESTRPIGGILPDSILRIFFELKVR